MLVWALVAAAAVLFETLPDIVQSAAACASTATLVERVQAVAECLVTAQPLTDAVVPFEVPAPLAEAVFPAKGTPSVQL